MPNSNTKQPEEKHDGFWKKLGNGLAEIIGQLIYQGPR
jgi:hypothetical protein